MATILCLDDEPAIGLILHDTLERAGHQVVSAHNVPLALQALKNGTVDLIISDYQMSGLTGLEFLALLREEGYQTPLMMLIGYDSSEQAIDVINAGAISYISKPVRPEQLGFAVNQALEVVRLRRENDRLRREAMAFRSERQIIGDGSAIRRALQTIDAAAPTRAPILIEGESGTGKTLFAHSIHARSDRRDGPFVKLNCGALASGLVESALFGHEKGAFAGASKRVEGAFDRAHGGTLLLGEISEMGLDVQAKLLRVLQEQEFERVGGTTAIRVDVRIVAATNRDLIELSSSSRFRQDLCHELTVIPVRLPPLRDRKEDIPSLAHRFARQYAEEIGKEISGISTQALELLQGYDWPGNVRELQLAVERAVILAGEPLLPVHAFDGQRFGPAGARSRPTPAHIPGDFFGTNGDGIAPAPTVPDGAVVLTSLDVGEAEVKLIARALETSGGNRTRAASLLGMSVRTLRNKLNGSKVGVDGE
jgi:DNA-binding NtrC family response regulator